MIYKAHIFKCNNSDCEIRKGENSLKSRYSRKKSVDTNKSNKKEAPILRFQNKDYVFSIQSIIILILGSPTLSLYVYLFLELEINSWIQEIVAKQAVFLFNNIFNFNLKVIFSLEEVIPWKIFNPRTGGSFYITGLCSAIQVYSIFIGVIVCIPHSKALESRCNIMLRKVIILTFLIVLIYFINIFRIILILYFDDMGIFVEDIHFFLNYLSGFIAAIIFLIFLYKYIPEFFLSIIYFYKIYIRNRYFT